jgi:hypothetical protein
MEGLPPGVIRRQNGSLFREVTVQVAGGGTRKQVRQVTLDPDEAREKRIDYLHPQLGWVREGYKLEKDRDSQAIMDDNTAGMAVHEEDQSLKAVHFPPLEGAEAPK